MFCLLFSASVFSSKYQITTVYPETNPSQTARGNNQEKKCVKRHGLLTNFVILQIECNFEVYPSKTINAWAVLSLSILTLLKDRKSRMQNMVSKNLPKTNEKKIVRFLEALKTPLIAFEIF